MKCPMCNCPDIDECICDDAGCLQCCGGGQCDDEDDHESS